MPLPDLNFGTWAGITAALALLGGFWRQFLTFLKRIMDLVICRVVVKDDAAKAVMTYVWKNGHRSPFGLRLFGGLNSFVAPKKRMEIVSYEGITSEPLVFWLGRAPMLVGNTYSSGGTSKETPNVGICANDTAPVTIRYFRGTLNIDDLLTQAVKAYNDLRQSRDQEKKKVKRFNVFRMAGSAGYGSDAAPRDNGKPVGNWNPSASAESILQQIHHGEVRLLTWKPEELIESSSDAPAFTNHPVDPEILRQFDEIRVWLDFENWFRSKGIPWRRGYCLFGPTGTGKSTIIRNIAMEYDLPIYVFDLTTYDNRSFPGDWKTVMQNAPAIALIEDIDNVFHGRENVAVKDKTKQGLTFDCLLNTISGVGTSDGVLLFVTTNHIEQLDPALGQARNGDSKSTRPGRIDRVIEVGVMGENERRKLAQILLGDWPEIVEETVVAGAGETAAQFQERCAQIAIRAFWEKGTNNPVEKPESRGEAGLSEQQIKDQKMLELCVKNQRMTQIFQNL